MLNLQDKIKRFNKVYIQTHNNPDVDAIACAYAVHRVCEKMGKPNEVIYYGARITKPNIVGIMNYLKFYPNYNRDIEPTDKDLLITVDCRYGRRNVHYIEFNHVLCIDHHLQDMFEDKNPECEIEIHNDDTRRACSSIMLKMLQIIDFPLDRLLATALYYGLLSDSVNFTESLTDLDQYTKKLLEGEGLADLEFINKNKCNNISLNDLKLVQQAIASLAMDTMLDNIAILHVEVCDQNILGYIADLILEVNGIDIVVCFFETELGYRLSVRSCLRDLNAYDIIRKLTEGIGEGGGHVDKAGGFVEKAQLIKTYPNDTMTSYINRRIYSIKRDN